MNDPDDEEILSQRASVISNNKNEGIRQRRVSQKDLERRGSRGARSDKDYNPLIDEHVEQK